VRAGALVARGASPSLGGGQVLVVCDEFAAAGPSSRYEERPDGLFATFEDLDGNLAQVLELDAGHLVRRASLHP
jgi:hypothetical protein